MLVANLENRVNAFISQYIHRFAIEREVPVWEGSADGLVRSLRKYLCSHGIPKWNAVFRFGDRLSHARAYWDKGNGLSEIRSKSPFVVFVVCGSTRTGPKSR
jgi:hypothetical protein